MIQSEEDARAYVQEHFHASKLRKIDAFVSALKIENREQNLVSETSVHDVWQRHVVDSLQLLRLVPRETSGNWLDLGTGAGMPGLMVAIAQEKTEVVLVESRARRVEWLNSQIAALNLSNCTVRGSRLEMTQTFTASVISARAFAPLPKLLRLAARFSTTDTVWLLPKGRSAAQEVADLSPKLRRLFHVEPSITSRDAGIVVGRGLEAKAL